MCIRDRHQAQLHKLAAITARCGRRKSNSDPPKTVHYPGHAYPAYPPNIHSPGFIPQHVSPQLTATITTTPTISFWTQWNGQHFPSRGLDPYSWNQCQTTAASNISKPLQEWSITAIRIKCSYRTSGYSLAGPSNILPPSLQSLLDGIEAETNVEEQLQS